MFKFKTITKERKPVGDTNEILLEIIYLAAARREGLSGGSQKSYLAATMRVPRVSQK